MQQVTIGTKNQIVIPKEIREKIEGLRPGEKVDVYARGDEVVIKAEKKSWVERTAGLMSEAWKGRDMIQELEEMRNEW